MVLHCGQGRGVGWVRVHYAVGGPRRRAGSTAPQEGEGAKLQHALAFAPQLPLPQSPLPPPAVRSAKIAHMHAMKCCELQTLPDPTAGCKHTIDRLHCMQCKAQSAPHQPPTEMRILTSGLIWRRAKVWGYRSSSSFHSTGLGEKSADKNRQLHSQAQQLMQASAAAAGMACHGGCF